MMKRILIGGQLVAIDDESGMLIARLGGFNLPRDTVVTVGVASQTLAELLGDVELLRNLAELTIRNQGNATIYMTSNDRDATTDDMQLPAGGSISMPLSASGAARWRFIAEAEVKLLVLQFGEE